MKYFELNDNPIDPNRSKLWAVLLCLVAVLIALMTIRSNYDYFAQYFDGWAFWMRVIPFFAVEITICLLPLAIGWGNRSQLYAAAVCEVFLIVIALIHTSLVGQSIMAKLQAAKTKSEAQTDFEKTRFTVSAIAASNQKSQENYSQQMREWRRAAATAQANNLPAPLPPSAPQMQAVPQINQSLVDNANLNVEEAAEAQVDHNTLLRLLYVMIGGVIATALLLVKLADSSRIKVWLLKLRAQDVRNHNLDALPSRSPSLRAPAASRRVTGFSQSQDTEKDGEKDREKDKDSKTGEDCIGDGESLCLRTIRQRLKSLSAQNPGLSFKVDGGRRHVLIRAMRAEQGRQVTQATLRIAANEAQSLIEQPARACKNDLVSRFASQNLRLNS